MTPEKALRIDAEQAQIKNIKLLIVTDIKVSTDSSSFSGFRLGWVGLGTFILKKKDAPNCTIVFSHVIG